MTALALLAAWIAASVPIALVTGRALGGRPLTLPVAAGAVAAFGIAVALSLDASSVLAIPTP
jgi:hypothetical protein